jgi:hypothetical protein
MQGQNGNGFGHSAVNGASERGEIAFRGHGGRRPRVLAHGGNGEKHLIQDPRYLYWTDAEDGTVTRISKGGGVPVVLASGLEHPGAITLADGYLYWVNQRLSSGTVVRMPASGGEVELLAENQDGPVSIAASGNTVVWTNFADGLATGTLMRKQIGGRLTTLASKQKQPGSVAIDAEQIYWTSFGIKRPAYFRDGAMMRIPREGGPKRFVVAREQSMARSVVLDDEWIYWCTADELEHDPALGGIKRRRKAGGATQDIVSWSQDTGCIALDRTRVYWLQQFGGALFRVRKEGGEPEQIMAGNGDRMLWVEDLVVDDRCVYWTARQSAKAGGAVFTMGK